jgi:hypothetical protein
MSRQVKVKQFFPVEDACDSGLSTWEQMCHSLREILITLGFHICGLERQFGFLSNTKSLINQNAPSKS